MCIRLDCVAFAFGVVVVESQQEMELLQQVTCHKYLVDTLRLELE